MLDKFLWKIILKIQKNGGGMTLSERLINSQLCKIYNNIQYGIDGLRPTIQMEESREFFQNNQERVENVVRHLNDKKSKEVYCHAVLYRCTHAHKDRPDYNRKDQYFPQDIVTLSDHECFIDCGAYNGDTIYSFLDFSNEQYKKIVAIEPDQENCDMINKLNLKNLSIVKGAAWNKDEEIYFSEGKGSGSHVLFNKASMHCVPGIRIDSIPACSDCTFIKMDIEGSEYNALVGAYETIRKNRPQLAICIYHSDEDMVRVFELIDSWDLGYQFYVRHHAQKIAETVMYAIPKCLDI